MQISTYSYKAQEVRQALVVHQASAVSPASLVTAVPQALVARLASEVSPASLVPVVPLALVARQALQLT